MLRLSTVAVSTLVPALKVLSTTLPESTFFSVVRTNAPPLPGLTCWNSTTLHSPPSRLSTIPFFRSFVVAMRYASLSSRTDVWVANPSESTLPAGQVLQRQPVAVDAQADDHPGRHRGEVRVVPELLTGVHVGDVHLDQRAGELGAGVAYRHGGVGPGGGVQHHRGALVGGFVQPGQQLVLGVGLPYGHVHAELLGGVLAEGHQVGVRGRAVDLRLPGTEPAEVGAVEDVRLHRATSAKAARSRSGSGSARMPGLARSSSTTNLSVRPRAFLSTRIAGYRSSQASTRYAVGSPSWSSTWRCRAAVPASRRPASRDSAPAYARPTETAWPCRHRYASTFSIAWPRVWP